MEIIVVLIIIALIALGEYNLYEFFVLKNVEYHLYLSKTEAVEGETIEIIEEVVNKKLLPVPWLKSEISTSRWLEFASSKVSEISDNRFVPSVFALRPYQKCTRTRKVKCLKRGVFRLSDTVISASDLLGAVTKTRKVSVDAQITVLPSPYGIQLGTQSDKEYFGDLIVRRFMCEDPFVISGVRESTGREPMSKIHWNSTARNGKLMVFNNEYTTTNRTLIVINMGKSDEGLLRPLMASELETYIKATAFLLDDYQKLGISAAFAANGSGENGFFAPLGSGSEHFTGILRRLALLENTCCFDVVEMLTDMRLDLYTDIVIFSGYLSEQMALFAQRESYGGKNVIIYCNDDKELSTQTIRIGRVSESSFGA